MLLLHFISFTLASLLICLWSSYYVKKWLRRKSSPPGPWGFPIIGNLQLLQRGTRPHEVLTGLRKKYGSIVSVQLGNLQTVVLNDTKVIKEACSMPEFEGRTDMSLFRLATGGQSKGIMFNDGPHGMEQRIFAVRHLRAFSHQRESREALVLEDVAELLRNIEQESTRKGFKTPTPIAMKLRFAIPVVNSLWKSLIGTRQKHDAPHLVRLTKLAETITTNYGNLTVLTLFFPWLAGAWFSKFSEAKKVVEAHLEFVDITKTSMNIRKGTRVAGQPRDFTDAYFDKMEATTDPESSFHAKTGNDAYTMAELIGAGLESGSSTLEWITIYLALNPAVQKKLQEEIDQILSSREGQPRLPSLADQSIMTYAMAVIEETLRITTVTPLALWHRAVEDTTFHGYKIPKDTVIIPNLHGANHDPEVWGEDADLFRPERFIENDGQLLAKDGEDLGRAKDWVITFGVGRRACVGEALAREQLFLFMVAIFQKFRVTCSAVPPSMESQQGVVIAPQPFELLFHPRT